MRVARGGIGFIPPSQTHESASSNVFEVVEVRGEKEDCGDEDEDEVVGEEDTEEVGQRPGWKEALVGWC